MKYRLAHLVKQPTRAYVPSWAMDAHHTERVIRDAMKKARQSGPIEKLALVVDEVKLVTQVARGSRRQQARPGSRRLLPGSTP